jgi:KDO2-lipid IV(A) lauroyltransferase
MSPILYAPLYSLAYFFSLLPLAILYRIAGVLYVLAYHVFGYRREVVIQNLSRAFPEREYMEIKALSKGFYRSFTDWMAEIVKLFSISQVQLERQVELTNVEFIHKCIGEGRNVIAGMGHFGNWEMLSILPRLLDLEVVSVYKPMRNRVMDKILYKLRSRFGMRLISSPQVVRHMLQNKHNPSLYLFIADQCPAVADQSERVLFLNQSTNMLPGIEKLAKAGNSAVVYFFMKRTGRGTYHIECIPICEFPQEAAEVSITTSYKELLEYNIMVNPDNWLWTHKRWKR